MDLDGTVYLDGIIIDQVDFEIRRLSNAGVKFFYLTNNTSIGTNQYVNKLMKLGINTTEDNIISPLKVFSNYCTNNPTIKSLFPIGTQSFVEELQRLTDCDITAHDPDAIIVGFDRELTYEKLEVASRLIARGVPYFLTHIDLFCPTVSGPIPDCGAIGQMLFATTSIEYMDHFGKPSENLITYLKSLKLFGENSLLVGDRLHTDGELGLTLDVDTILVRSGEFKGTQSDVPAGITVEESLSVFLRKL